MYRELVCNRIKQGSITVMEGDTITIKHVAGKADRTVVCHKIPDGTPPRTFSHAVIFEVEEEHGFRDGIGGMLANPE